MYFHFIETSNNNPNSLRIAAGVAGSGFENILVDIFAGKHSSVTTFLDLGGVPLTSFPAL